MKTRHVLIGIMCAAVAACDANAPAPEVPSPSAVGAAGASPAGNAAAVAGVRAAATAHAHHATTAAAGGQKVELKMTPEIAQQLDELRRLVAPFHNFDKAVEYGYSIPAPGPGVCISDPVRGGMGYHYTYAHKDLIGDGEVNLLEPEFLVYAPKENGGVKFAALDYFVPYDTWVHDDPPSLLGVDFAREDGFQAWVLHIWLFWHNPAGLFENFNPAVPLC
ncbi:MAG TPA: hypothetical protein VD833_19015 [Vicinamibacterales bacterium]|nr:hypothetical protein [Vicinamibacterales bacterium]